MMAFLWKSPWPVLDLLEVEAPWRVLRPLDVGSYYSARPLTCNGSRSHTYRPKPLPSGQFSPPSHSLRRKCAASCDVAMVVRGLAFRIKHGGSEVLGTMESVAEQLRAAWSHVRYIAEPLEASGCHVDVLGAIYKTPYLDRLLEVYGGRVAANFTLVEPPGSQRATFKAALKAVTDHAAKRGLCYRAVFIVRVDLILKQSVPALIHAQAAQEKVLAPFWCERASATAPWAASVGGGSCTSDVFHYVPWRLVPALASVELAEEQLHDVIASLVNDGVPASDVGTLLPHLQIAGNPIAQWNPLYSFANRYGPVRPLRCVQADASFA